MFVGYLGVRGVYLVPQDSLNTILKTSFLGGIPSMTGRNLGGGGAIGNKVRAECKLGVLAPSIDPNATEKVSTYLGR